MAKKRHPRETNTLVLFQALCETSVPNKPEWKGVAAAVYNSKDFKTSEIKKIALDSLAKNIQEGGIARAILADIKDVVVLRPQ